MSQESNEETPRQAVRSTGFVILPNLLFDEGYLQGAQNRWSKLVSSKTGGKAVMIRFCNLTSEIALVQLRGSKTYSYAATIADLKVVEGAI